MTNDYKLAVLTWNLAGGKDYSKINAADLINSVDFDELPDIFILGFQETTELNFFSVIVWGHNKTNNVTISSLFETALNLRGEVQGKQYFCFAEKPMIG